MTKPRKLSRPEIEGLAAFFGCQVITTLNGSMVGESYAVYIVCKGNQEKVGTVGTNNPIYLDWTNHDWTKAFQRVSGQSTANLWEQGRRNI